MCINDNPGYLPFVDKYKNIFSQEKFKLFLEILPIFSAALTWFLNMVYQFKCEEYYGVPRKYFTVSLGSTVLWIVFNLMVLGLVYIVVLKRSNKIVSNTMVDNVTDVMIVGLAGMFLGFINLINIGQAFNINIDGIILSIVMISAVITTIGIVFYNKGPKSVSKKFDTFIIVIFSAHVTFMLVGIIISLFCGPNQIKEYEFIKYNNQKYVVLTEYKDKSLVVKFEKGADGQYTFDTKEYLFVDYDAGVRSYKNVLKAPKIDKLR